MATKANSTDRLLAAIDDAYDRAATCFLQDSPSSLRGVIWLSAHLAAMERAIETGPLRRVPEAQDQLKTQRQLGLRLQALLRNLERQRAGDALAPHAAWPNEREALLDQLGRHATGERTLIRLLVTTLNDEAIDKLLKDYSHAFERGPTRPHPYGPHGGRLGNAMFRLSAARDHVLDVLDSRTSPIPRKRADRPPLGRWAQYFLGTTDNVDERVAGPDDGRGERPT
jgi:hypothetical protein